MTTKPVPTDLPIHYFPDRPAFEAFLCDHHTTSSGIHIKFARKASGIPSIAPAEAVETALCFGWIDGQGNSFDDNYFLARYTPRRAKSMWSKKNVGTIARLLDEGRLRPAGLAAVEAAKADGRWERAYAGPATIQAPEDFTSVLNEHDVAKAFFEGLNKSDRYAVLWRIETGSVKTRQARIAKFVEMLADGKTPGAESRAKYASKPAKVVKKQAATRRKKPARAVAIDKPKPSTTTALSALSTPRRVGLRPRP